MSNSVSILRRFSTKGINVIDEVVWKKFDAVIKDHSSAKPMFEQKDVEFPEFYSQRSVNIITSKYFRGILGTKNREQSYKELISRVVNTNVAWGKEQGYFQTDEDEDAFKQELTHILVYQKAYFNSPVWFNMGFPGREQTSSACFINSIEDTLESIMDTNALESKIFQRGSGSGLNMSSLRSKYEPLSTGGTSSGVLSFMKVLDINAGVTKSAGATRRAAKMVILNVDHPEIVDFINCKIKEEKKAHALIREGYDPSYNGEAYSTIAYQNANNSVRVTDSFMEKAIGNKDFWTKLVKTGKNHKKYNASDILYLMSKAVWESGDPGIQFHDTINKWNTCKSDECCASNPCSEYLAQTDSSCNLSSLNLMSFLCKETGEFKTDDFIHTCWIMSLAQDIWIDNGQYPSDKISEATKTYRTIGLGYSNLGSLLMASGLPYDSDEGRFLTSAITSLMTAVAYERSMSFCSILPPFPKWGENKESMMEVLKMHSEETNNIEKNEKNKKILTEANKIWNKILKHGKEKGFRNSYVSNIAPCGTISFAMDCETTGCEPAMALVVYKLLAGSDVTMEIINQTVPIALKNIGYNEEKIRKIEEHILAHNSVDNCDIIKKEHLPIFDTSIGNDGRTISHMGHLKMLKAIQPFISGGISKTINMSKTATVEDITEAYITAWKIGIKCVAIYRDGSKGSQPLTTIKEKRSRATRVRLPDDVESTRHKFTINGQDTILQCGKYPDGELGEIFVTTAQQGSTMRGLLDSWAITFSVSLQYGVPLKTLIGKFLNTQFQPHGFTGKKDIVFCSSIVDYIVRYLALKFLSEKDIKSIGITSNVIKNQDEKENPVEKLNINDDEDNINGGSLCSLCGSFMSTNGSCKVCNTCGSTTGCS